MTTEEMTIHQALCELKILDDRIQKAINTKFAIANKHSNKIIGGRTLEQYIEGTKAAYQQAQDLIRRREAIKKAIVTSNANTKVVIGNDEMTVAEAIEMKANGINYWKNLLNQLNDCFHRACNDCASNNENALETRADDYIRSMFGNTDIKNASSEIVKARQLFIEAQTYEVVDPLDCVEEIQKWSDKIDIFVVNVDSALSVSNALTKITIQY